jgi:diacylglycerol kinase (ATP)
MAQEPSAAVRRPINWSVRSLLASFRYAFRGLHYFFMTQRNAQIHGLISLCVVALGVVLGIERWEWLALVIMIALVLAAEALNTAIEAAVDVATSQYHPMARIAKDVAAGAVVLCAAGAVVVGCLVFLPHLWPLVLSLIGRY